jgi:hypothetical protein
MLVSQNTAVQETKENRSPILGERFLV